MNDRIISLLSLNDGKREYRQIEGEVDRFQFKYSQTLYEVLFGERGYAETLGPTWHMVHDPRFKAIEAVSVVRKEGKTKGAVIERGIVRQNTAGEFDAGADDIVFYSEVLSEGRYILKYLRSKRYEVAIDDLFWTRKFNVPAKMWEPGLYKYSKLNRHEQEAVDAYINGSGDPSKLAGLFPADVKSYTDDQKWALIKEICPNYFSRTEVVNPLGHMLFSLLNADLVGLVNDYSEVANLQEWVLVDSEFELADPNSADDETHVVWAEVEMLEQALLYRTSIRFTAARILEQIGIPSYLSQTGLILTEHEQDELLKIIYNADWPTDKPGLMNQVIQYLGSIQASGKDYHERVEEQTTEAARVAQCFVEGLKNGTILPVNRETDGTVEQGKTSKDSLIDALMKDPIKQQLFMRLSGIEGRIAAAEKLVNVRAETDDDPEARTRLYELKTSLQPALDLLTPYFTDADAVARVVTEEEAEAVLAQVDKIDPTVLPVATLSEHDAWDKAQLDQAAV